jgi:anti-sigma B factor antagonist
LKNYTLFVTGKVNGTRAPQIQAEIDKLIADGVTDLIVNMKDVDYFSSMGIRVLLSSYKALKAKGGSLTVVEPSEFVFNTLAFVGLDEYIVDKSTVVKSENESDCDYSEPLTSEYDCSFSDIIDSEASAVTKLSHEFFDKINASQDFRNGYALFGEEIRMILAYNKKDGYGTGVFCHIELVYTPSPKQFSLTIFCKNHSLAQFAKNLKRMNTKSFEIGTDSEEYAEELAKRAAFAFYDKTDVKNLIDGVKFTFTKNLK